MEAATKADPLDRRAHRGTHLTCGQGRSEKAAVCSGAVEVEGPSAESCGCVQRAVRRCRVNPLRDYIALQLWEKVDENHGIAVWYDRRLEFEPFLRELVPADKSSVQRARLVGHDVSFAEFDGSYLAIRAAVEPLIAAD